MWARLDHMLPQGCGYLAVSLATSICTWKLAPTVQQHFLLPVVEVEPDCFVPLSLTIQGDTNGISWKHKPKSHQQHQNTLGSVNTCCLLLLQLQSSPSTSRYLRLKGAALCSPHCRLISVPTSPVDIFGAKANLSSFLKHAARQVRTSP